MFGRQKEALRKRRDRNYHVLLLIYCFQCEDFTHTAVYHATPLFVLTQCSSTNNAVGEPGGIGHIDGRRQKGQQHIFFFFSRLHLPWLVVPMSVGCMMGDNKTRSVCVSRPG